MTSTFVPKGSFSFNPKMLSEEPLDEDIFDDGLSALDDLSIKQKDTYRMRGVSTETEMETETR